MSNHNGDIKNKNKGTIGTNKTYKKVLNNRSNQLNPNHPEYKGSKDK